MKKAMMVAPWGNECLLVGRFGSQEFHENLWIDTKTMHLFLEIPDNTFTFLNPREPWVEKPTQRTCSDDEYLNVVDMYESHWALYFAQYVVENGFYSRKKARTEAVVNKAVATYLDIAMAVLRQDVARILHPNN